MGKKSSAKYAVSSPTSPEEGHATPPPVLDVGTPLSHDNDSPGAGAPSTSGTPFTPGTGRTTPAAAHDVTAGDLVRGLGGGLLSAGRKGSFLFANSPNRKELKKVAGGLLGTFLVDPMEEAEELNVVFDSSKLANLISLIYYLLFLAIFSLVIFIRVNTQEPFRMQYQMQKMLTTGEYQSYPLPTKTFDSVTTSSEVYEFAKTILVPTLYNQEFYNGDAYPETDAGENPYFLTGDSSVTLGAVRLRQIRVRNDTCVVLGESSSAASETVTASSCYGHYTNSNVDTGDYKTAGGNIYSYSSADALEDDGNWQSSQTLTIYGGGGYVVDLPVGVDGAVSKLEDLKAEGWIDGGTRALFMDSVNYCPNNDMFLTTRVVFEMLPSGNMEKSLVMEVRNSNAHTTNFRAHD